MTQNYFITATGTGIGKTLVTATLCWQLRQRGKHVTALKPVISGYDTADPESDSALLLRACGSAPTPQAIERISPWRYAAPLAPPMAAAKEGKRVDMDKLIAFCHEHATLTPYSTLLVEGAGGVMAPLTDEHTMLDWMAALGWPVVLVTGSYLGTLSHTLTAVEVLRMRGLTMAALIVSESPDSSVSLTDTIAALEGFVRGVSPVVSLPRLHGTELWKHMPDISRSICT